MCFCTGEVVKWDGDLYIVAEHEDDRVVLLPFDDSNCKMYITKTFPTKRRINCCEVGKWIDESEMGDCRCSELYEDDSSVCMTQKVPDETKTIETVECVANTLQQYLNGLFKKVMLDVDLGTNKTEIENDH